MIKALKKANDSLSFKKVKVKAKAQAYNIDDLTGDESVDDLPKGSIITGYIWSGSGYGKGEIKFVVKSGGYIEPASSKEWKTLQECWNTDKGVVESLVNWGNDATSSAKTIISFITDTESHSLIAESEMEEYGYDIEDDDNIPMGQNKKGEWVYFVRN